MFGESNLFLGFMVHQNDLDNLAQQIVNEYRKGNTTFTAQASFELSPADLAYVEDKVTKMLSQI